MCKYAHLHTHGRHSFKDGLDPVEEMVSAAHALGQPGLGLTDHGVLFGAPDLFKAVRKLQDQGEQFKGVIGCLLAGQPIHTSEGVKAIENLAVGDRVLTHRGRFQRVIRTMQRLHQGDLWEIEWAASSGGRTLRLTGEHPVLVADAQGNRQWLRPADIPFGRKDSHRRRVSNWRGYVCLPKLQQTPAAINVAESVAPTFTLIDGRWQRTIQRGRSISQREKARILIAGGSSIAAAGRKVDAPYASVKRWIDDEDRRPSWHLPDTLPLTKDLAFFLGLYTAEGSIGRRGRITLSLGDNASDRNLAKWVVHFLHHEWGISASVYDRVPERKTVEVYWSHPVLAQLLATLCGRGANNKRVPDPLWNAPRNIKQSFLDGVLAGDGSHNTNGANNLKQSSEDLAWGCRVLLADLGYWTTVTPLSAITKYGTRTRCWHVSYKPNRSRARTLEDDQYLYKPIRAVRNLGPTVTPVYNVEVAHDHSYVSHFTLHNCEAYEAVPHTFDMERDGGVFKIKWADLNGQSRYFHITLWVMDLIGWQNICSLHTKSFTPAYHPTQRGKPLIDRASLERHSEGLMIGLGCPASRTNVMLASESDIQIAYNAAKWYAEVFEDRCYLEIMGNLPEQQALIRGQRKLAQRLGVKTVAVNDVHYVNREDGVEDGPHHILVQSRRFAKANTEESGERSDAGFGQWYGTDEFYLKSGQEMLATGGITQADCECSLEILDRVTFDFDLLPEPKQPTALIPTPGEDPAFDQWLAMAEQAGT